jgi:diadenosine tetraphosphate (Ap4A) HIT family hydrolase
MKTFKLDSRLEDGSEFIIDWPLSTLRFKNQAHFPWCILIPRVPDLSEIYQLNDAQQLQLMQEVSGLSRIMQDYFVPDKLNIASLGNQVAQLHIHVVGRYRSDPLWPQGIWQAEQTLLAYPKPDYHRHILHLEQASASYFVDRK